MPFGIRGWEPLIIVLIIVVLIWGPKQLPILAKSIGKSIKQFRSGMKEAKEDLDSEPDDENETGEDPKKT